MKHIYYRNDFAVEVELFNLEGVKVSPPEWQWSIEFSDSRKKYVCSLEKGNAEVMDDGSVMCYLDNHNFYCGRLSCKFKEQIPNLSYLDGFQQVIRPTDIDVELWDKASDGDDSVEVSVVPDYVVYDAYKMAVSGGYTGTIEQFYESLVNIGNIADDEDLSIFENEVGDYGCTVDGENYIADFVGISAKLSEQGDISVNAPEIVTGASINNNGELILNL